LGRSSFRIPAEILTTDGLFVAVRRRFEAGLDFGFSYTFSKSIDDMSIDPTGAATGGGLTSTNSRTPTDIHNWRLDRALSDFNNTHVLLANLLYEFSDREGQEIGLVHAQLGEPDHWWLVLHGHLRIPEWRALQHHQRLAHWERSARQLCHR